MGPMQYPVIQDGTGSDNIRRWSGSPFNPSNQTMATIREKTPVNQLDR